jgi:hypothetical protein
MQRPSEDSTDAGSFEVPSTQNKRLSPGIKGTISLLVLGLSLGVADITRRKRLAERQILARRIIAAQMDRFLSSPDVLRLAARQQDISQGNVELSACLLGGTLCTATDPENQRAFGLRSNMDVHSELLVGTESNPAKYSKDGAVDCGSTDDPDCPGWMVKAWFWAECEGRVKSCPIAKQIHVRYQVAPGPSLAHLPASPLTEMLQSDPYAYAKAVPVNRL